MSTTTLAEPTFDARRKNIPLKRCAYEKCSLGKFKPRRKTQRYCSKRCAQLHAWSSDNPDKRKDFIRCFFISHEDLSYRLNVLGQDCTMIAALFHKSPATVFRKAKQYGIKPVQVRKAYRPVYLPKDKVCIVLKVDSDRGADLEVITKGILREQRLDTRTHLEIFPAVPV